MGNNQEKMMEDFNMSLLKFKIPDKKQVPDQYRFNKPFYEHKYLSAFLGEVNSTGKKLVIKKIKKVENLKKKFLKEIFILCKLDHPSIIQIFEFFQSPGNYFIIYPYFEGSPVIDFYLKNQKMNTLSNYKKFFFEVLNTMSYLHENGVSHRDLVPKYILWDGENLVICGFNQAGIFSQKKNIQKIPFTNKTIYNLYFTSPEMLEGKYTYKNDIWNVGVLFYLILAGKTPFNGNSENAIKLEIKNKEPNFSYMKKKKYPNSLIEMIKNMLSKNPDDRMDFQELKKSEFFISKKETKIKERLLSEDSQNLHLQDLKRFNKKSRFFYYLKKYVIRKFLSKKDKKELTELFRALDTNGNGVLEKNELENITDNTVSFLDLKQIDNFIKKNDLNKNGVIEYSEFLNAYLNVNIMKEKNILDDFFFLIDRNNSSNFSFEDFTEVLGYHKNEKVIKNLFDKFSSKGLMDKDHFVKFIDAIIENYSK